MRSATHGQQLLATKGMCHGLSTSKIGMCNNDPHNTETSKVYSIYSYWSTLSFYVSPGIHY